MQERPLDPNYEKLVASLYGELSAEEERELQELLVRDAALREEFEELREAHRALGVLEAEETVPSFVFLTEEPPAEAAREGWWARVQGFFDRLGAGPSWAVATAAVVIAVLALSDFRIQSVDGGLAFRFGEPENAPVQTSLGPGVTQPLGEFAGGPQGSVGAVPAGFVSRQEFDDYQQRVFELMTAMIQDYGKYRDQQTAGLMRAMYEEMTRRQDNQYGDLRGRIEAVGLGLLLEQAEPEMRYQDLPGVGGTIGQPPAELTPVSDTKENQQ